MQKIAPPASPATGSRPPHVSVVVPCYNYGRFLRQCVESVVTQSGVVVDVLIVDDASTDSTAEVAAAISAADPRVSVLRHEHNRGHIDTFNDGLGAVEGEYVVKLDADDMLPPGALARATALLEEHPSVGFVYGRPAHFTGIRPPIARTRVRSWTVWPGREWIEQRCHRGFNCISNPEVVMRASVMREVGLHRHALPHTSDLDMWLRLAAVSEVGRVNGSHQGWYRVHADSFQRTIHAGPMIDLRGRRDAFAWAFAGPAGLLPGADHLHATARRVIAGQALDRACRAYDRGRTDEVPVEELIEFARDLWPNAPHLQQWRALQMRRRVGPERARCTPRFVVRAAVRRAGETLARWRWQRTGL